ncbi:UNVERIFIED_CONTAM: hypothetical protein PYX00_005251 [Menopon gallinae]|uniref:Uncharacterized protein n=1 Tax=Menopon gallinae TaxID=328185 RepID=A0AAW2HRS7_9NEOP
MSTALNLPLWECNSPPNSPDSSEDLDLIAGRFSSGEKPFLYGDSEDTSQIPLDNGMPARRLSSGSDCDSVGRVKFEDACRLNNNVSDFGDCDVEKCNAECASASSKRRRSRNVSSDGDRVGRSKRRRSSGKSSDERPANVKCGPSGDAGTVGGDDDEDEEDGRERSPRRQRELTPSAEINNRDVTASRDITSNPSIGSKARTSDGRRGTCGEGDAPRKGSCSAGSYSRRKHHKHHKHRRRTPTPEEITPVSPKVNPIFLWVKQDDTRIVEVMCEDYDHRNRIRLTRTHLGWRAIPKTERFAAAIIPKAPPAPEVVASEETKRSRRKKGGKKKKLKKRKVPVQSKESLNAVKECSVTITRDDVEQCLKPEESENHSECKAPSRSPSPEPAERKTARLTKSFSCDFSPAPKPARNLTRSASLDLNMDGETRLELERNFKVQIESGAVAESAPEVKTEVEEEPTKEEDAKKPPEEEKVPSEVIDVAKQDPDFNDADCDELGELLKDIPDLEFVEEEELEQEDEEWSTPTDLTVPKAKIEEKECTKVKLPVLPSNISSLVTVTSATRLPEPLTAPLPEVTITPIPNPKPAHQQKRQNNFLESLLSSPYPVKPEKDEITVTRSIAEKRPEKKKLPQVEDSRNKKMKMEDITLKSLLSKQSEKMKGTELENHVKKIKSKHESESTDLSKSRLHELLTEGVSSSGSDPIAQLKQVLSNPDLAVPDPLLVPRARLPALVASPASEIPRLLSMHLDKKIEEKRCPPLMDSDMLEVSLSNLRSLLSCNTDKTKSTDGDDIASYQKSLEAFLEWQRYQTDLLESQMKNAPLTPGLSPADIDLATATALNQMLWLPYLELNGNTVSSPVNSVFPQYPNGMTALPHISTNHFPQSSPFLTPTSPMDIDAQMKTLAMWQEAVMSQSAQQSRKVPSTLLPQDRLKIPNVQQQQKKQRPSPIPSPQKVRNYSPRQEPQKTHFNFDNHLQLQQLQQQQEGLLRQQYEMQRKQKRTNDLHRQRQEQSAVQHMQLNLEEAEKKNRASISVKPLSNLIDRNGRHGKKQPWQQFEQDLRKNAEMTNQMALRWHQFEEEMRKNRVKSKIKAEANADWQTGSAQEKPPEQKKETAKLKVKNLVDPNMSPPKLLKQIAPEVPDDAVPIQDESQAHLWHPLFGSNQIKTQQYNSPWRWTTVTVNGE